MPSAARQAGGLPYRRPIFIGFISGVLMILLTYLALGSHVSPSQDKRLQPAYVNYLRHNAPSFVADIATYFENVVMNGFYDVGHALFGSLRGIQMVCAGAWLVHVGEVLMCLYLCRKANATLSVMLRYVLGVLLSGGAQMQTLTKAKKQYESQKPKRKNK